MDKLYRRVRFFRTKRKPSQNQDNRTSPEQREKEEQLADHSINHDPTQNDDALEKSWRQKLQVAKASPPPQTHSTNGPQSGLRTQKSPPMQAAHQSSSGLYDCLTPMTRCRLNTLAQIGEDWLYLALLGIIMALLSLSMDSMITMFLETRIWLSEEMEEQNLLLQYLAWCIVPIFLVTFSTGFVHLCSPTAIGSGIPEMKTILRGVVLNEYLTFRTLVAKIVGLTFTLGSGLPLGKEGPSVHMASIVATLLSKLVASFQGIYENESRTSEMLSAACAVGVAATFYAPIGGVLFSIEVTTVYFAVRNYWRGFFAACCGATIWRLLGFYIQNDESISAIFKTNFSTDYPFDPIELLVFSFIGATCGLAGAAYIKFHREIVQFFRRHKRVSGFLQQNRFVYPSLVTLIITTSTFPPFLGRYTAATLSTHTTIENLFSNRTWSLGPQDLVSKQILDSWTTESTNFHLHLVLYILMLFWTSALASTIPTPSGVFIPVVKLGAAYGRLIGELMAWAYPLGIKYSHSSAPIIPGSYAVVGAAAFSGAVTHTVSTSVILFEMTGQIVHIIPVILGVLISNAVCQSLQPSIYDSIIEIKKLPYLPPIASSNSVSHRILVKDFMNTKNIPFVWKERCTYADLKALLSTHKKIISFPLVESPQSMKLLGSVARPDLLKLLYLHLGRERRLQEVYRRNSDTMSPAIYPLSTISGRLGSQHNLRQYSQQPVGADASKQSTVIEKKTSVDSTSSSQHSSIDDKGLQFKSVGNAELLVEGLAQLTLANDTCVDPRLQKPHLSSNRILLERQNSNISDSSTIVGVYHSPVTSYQPPEVDWDPTRLIISPAIKHCNKYGATSATATGTPPKASEALKQRAGEPQQQAQRKAVGFSSYLQVPQQKFGEEQLLSDCQKRRNAYEKALQEFGGVAKMVNHYDRGSSMDEEHLDKSIQEVEGHLASASQRPRDIVIVAPKSSALEPEQTLSSSPATTTMASRIPKVMGSHNPETTLQLAKTQAPRPPRQQLIKSNSSQLVERRHGQVGNSQPPPLNHVATHSTSSTVYQQNARQQSHSVSSSPSLSSRPTKSILKTSSFNNMSKRSITSSASFTHNHHLHHPQYNVQPSQQPGYLTSDFLNNSTNLSLDSYNQQALNQQQIQQQQPDEIQKSPQSNQLNGLKFTLTDQTQVPTTTTTTTMNEEEAPPEQQVRQRRKVRLSRLRVVDMTPEEQKQWEKEQLSAYIDINKCQIDEAPFQLVEQTSLYRVHTLFSMLGLNHAYVTSFGRLVGIVALKDIRYAIERMLQEKV